MARRERASVHDEPQGPNIEETQKLLQETARRYIQYGIDPTPIELAAMRAGLREGPPICAPRPVHEAVVYYFRVGNRIKIGHTVNLAGRVANLMPEEVLGWEPGERQLETKRHRQFANHRIIREWFEDCPTIRRHIEQNCRTA